MSNKTADICDAHPDDVAVAEPVFTSFGGRSDFCGPIVTVSAHEDNVLVRQALEQPGEGRVLVVDGGASMRCALLGDRLAATAAGNGWSGVIINGCVRDTAELSTIDLGIMALRPVPLKSNKRGEGRSGEPLRFASVTFSPGDCVYVDGDGVVVLPAAIGAGRDGGA